MKKLTEKTTLNQYIYIYVLVIMCVTQFNVNAQNPYLNSANAQLRSIFSQITYPSPDVKFLYERSAKLSDSSFYQNNSPDTLIYTTWFQLYDEMYYAAHDTLPLTTHTDLEDFGDSFSNDTIPIAIMDYDWYYCSNNSLTTNTYFNFDTINNVLTDKPGRPGWPFGQSNLFAVSPMRISTNFINPTFRIDPYSFFSDLNNTPLYSSVYTNFRIDFGDGTGWHVFDPSVISHYQVTYGNVGVYEINAEIIGEGNNVLKSSKSLFNVAGKAKSNQADEVLDMPGMNIGVFNSCNGNNGKIIIYLEGIDIPDVLKSQNRGIDEIYEQMIHRNNIEELRAFDYTFYVVDWKHSTIDIRFNALYLVNLIEKLKQQYKTSDEQFVVIGESMGGLVGRYALTFMESKDYKAGVFNSFFVEANALSNITYLQTHPNLLTLGNANRDSELVPLMHKTRELITLDTPHQGANIPISLQLAYKNAIGMIVPSFKKYTNMFNIGMESHATKQMLIYHTKGKVFPNLASSPYLAAPEYYTFFSQLQIMGDYPEYAKLMAMSSGALDGTPQIDLVGLPRIPNDPILDWEISYNAHIVFSKIKIFGAQLKMLTNPNGTANVFQTGIGMFVPIIKLKWFGFSISSVYVGLLTDSQDAENVKAHCVSAGGVYDPGLKSPLVNLGFSVTSSSWGIFGPFGSTVSSMYGCLYLDSTFGFNGVFGAHNVSYSLCTKGFHFGFIPVQSALDYGQGLNLPLNHNLETENITIKLSRTPFDVITGYINGVNEWHLGYRDEDILNITQMDANCGPSSLPPGGILKNTYYDADIAGICDLRRGLLNLEIGDEEMYIENWTLNRPAVFQAQYDVRVNERNPYYQYPSGLQPLTLEGVYSKENDFGMTPDASAKFFYNTNGAPANAVGFSYTHPLQNGLWGALEIPMDICLINYSQRKVILPGEEEATAEENHSQLVLFPNPTAGAYVTCQFLFRDAGKELSFRLMDAFGKLILQDSSKDEITSNTYQFDVSQLESGIYFVTLSNGIESLTQKLIVK